MGERLAPGMRSTADAHEAAQRRLLEALPASGLILDVGCGDAALLRTLRARGHSVAGVEIDPTLVAAAVRDGLDVRPGVAEALPFADATVDAIVCSVVLPYTDQRRAIAEWGRVLRPGGVVNATYHGVGYGIQYALWPPAGVRSRVYGTRMLVNTAVYLVTGRRLPGFWGDTVCQTRGALRRAYGASALRLEVDEDLDRAAGVSRIIFHRLRRTHEAER